MERIEYSDGFSRAIQTRTQAEDVRFGSGHFGDSGLPIDLAQTPGNATGQERAANASVNVIVSGWQVYNNKGQVIEQYEPFFAEGWDFSTIHICKSF